MSYKVFLWELLGAVFISISGSLLHFLYGWTKQYKPLAIISAVNESTWEHLKIAFWPGLIFSIIEYVHISNLTNNFIIAKAACLLLTPVSIIVLFYSYTCALGRNFLFFDISIFILSIFLGQKVSMLILTMPELPSYFTTLAIFIIGILTMQFSLFTFFPPKFFIFRDPTNGRYGMV